MRIEARPLSLLAPHYRVGLSADSWTELWFDRPAGDARFFVEGRSYHARRLPGETLWRGLVRALRGRNLYQLEEDGAVAARATGGGVDYHLWTEAGPEFRLRRDGMPVQLLRDGVSMGHAGPRGLMARGLWAEFSPDVPAPIRLFAVWLLLCRWEIQHRA